MSTGIMKKYSNLAHQNYFKTGSLKYDCSNN